MTMHDVGIDTIQNPAQPWSESPIEPPDDLQSYTFGAGIMGTLHDAPERSARVLKQHQGHLPSAAPAFCQKVDHDLAGSAPLARTENVDDADLSRLHLEFRGSVYSLSIACGEGTRLQQRQARQHLDAANL